MSRRRRDYLCAVWLIDYEKTDTTDLDVSGGDIGLHADGVAEFNGAGTGQCRNSRHDIET